MTTTSIATKKFLDYLEETEYVGFSYDKITTRLNDKGEEKKIIKGLPSKWEMITKDSMLQKISNTTSTYAVITGKTSNVTGIDFDDIGVYNDFIRDFPYFVNARQTKTRNGYHIYCQYRNDIDGTTNKKGGVDFRNDGNHLISYPTEYKLLNGTIVKYEEIKGEIFPITTEILNWFDARKINYKKGGKKNEPKEKKKIVVIQPDDVSVATTSEEKEMSQKMRDYLEAVDRQKLGERLDWLRFTTACFVLGVPQEEWDDICREAAGYNRANNFAQWGKNEKGFGEGWGWRVLQSLCPPDKRRDLFQKYYDDFTQKMFSTGIIADFFVQNYGEKFIYNDETLYCYNGVYWEADDKTCSTLVQIIDNELYKTITGFVLDRIRYYTEGGDEVASKAEAAKKFLFFVNRLRDYNSRVAIVKDICCKLAVKRIEWDSNPYLIAFTNKIYDLRLEAFVCPDPDDLIKTTTGWAWDDSYPASRLLKVKEIVGQIFPKQEVGDYYLSALSTGLSGIILQNLFIATGGGANGKSVIDGLMMATIGDYGYKLASSILLQEIKGGANPEIANIHKKRFCLAQEPDKAKKIKTSVVKELTGDAAINARQNYSNDCRVQLLLTLVMECNTIPKVDEIDYAVQRRFRLIEFITKFVSQEEWEEYGETKPPNTFLKNETYTSERFKKEHRQAFFLLLAPYFKAFHEKGMPKQPQEVLAKQRAYFEGCDDLLGWFNDYYKPAEGAEPIPLKEIYKFYQSTPFFENLPKNQKREQKQSWFVEQMGKSKRESVKRRCESYNGKQLFSDCLVGYVLVADQD
jgi:phage/plasmid-associated DNA primase